MTERRQIASRESAPSGTSGRLLAHRPVYAGAAASDRVQLSGDRRRQASRPGRAVRAIARSRRSARVGDRVRPRAGRPGRPAPTGRRPGPGRAPRRAARRGARAYAASTASTYAGCAVEAQQVAEVGERVPGVRELPVEHPGDLERVRVDQQVLGVEVAVHQAGPADRVEQRLGVRGDRARAASTSAVARRPAPARAPSTHAGRPSSRRRRRSRRSASTNAPARSIGMPAEVGRPARPSRRPSAGQPRRRRASAAAGRRAPPGRNEVTSSPGRSAAGVAAAYLQHLGHRDQPADQPQHGRVDLGRRRRRAGRRRGRSGPPSALPRASARKVCPDQPPASGRRGRRDVHAPHPATSAAGQ